MIYRFRQDYKKERKLLLEMSLDYSTVNEEQLERLSSSPSPSSKHLISRVVVLHNNKLETFFTKVQAPSSHASILDLEAARQPFDNEAFWNGSITFWS